MNDKKKLVNEQKFKNWKPAKSGGRIYWFDVKGRHDWSARYVKEVDKNENTLRFTQEIYDENDILGKFMRNFL